MGGEVSLSCISPDQQYAAFVVNGTEIIIRELFSGKTTGRYKYHESRINSISYSRDGKSILSSSDDEPVNIIDTATGEARSWRPTSPIRDTKAKFSYDGSKLLLAGKDATVIIDMVSGAILRWMEDSDLRAVEFADLRGRGIIMGFRQGIMSQDVKGGDSLQIEASHVTGVLYLTGKDMFVCTDDYGSISFWNNETIQQGNKNALEGRIPTNGVIRALSLSHDGTLLAVSTDKGLDIYRIEYRYHFPGWLDSLSEKELFPAGRFPKWETIFEVFLRRCPNWTDGDFKMLVAELQNYGYGWLKPEGVRKRLLDIKTSGKH
jgi:WD40 repeat protein